MKCDDCLKETKRTYNYKFQDDEEGEIDHNVCALCFVKNSGFIIDEIADSITTEKEAEEWLKENW